MFAQIIATHDIRHIPGRLRIAVGALNRDPVFGEYLVKHLTIVIGIKSAAANHQTGRALIYYDVKLTDLPKIQGEIRKASMAYNHIISRPKAEAAAAAAENPDLKLSGPATAIDVPPPGLQLFNTVVTGGILAALVIKRAIMGRSMLSSSQKVFNLAAITTIIAGYPILRRGIGHLVRNKKVNHDLVISVATLILLAMRESITGLSVLWLVSLSGWFNYLVQARARKRIRGLLAQKTSKAWRLVNGQEVAVAGHELEAGDIVVVHRGEQVTVDGEVIDGEAVVNEAAVCGEFKSDNRCPGDKIFAGTMVETGKLKIRAEKVGKDTSLNRILSMVERSTAVRGKLEQTGEIFSGRLVPISIGAAIAIFLLTRDFQRSLAILLAGCPAAVALSSNTALGMAVARAAEQGILIKDVRYLELAEQADCVLFDKTGTLTKAKPQIAEIVSLDSQYNEDEILVLAASAEQATIHPLARMFIEEAKAKKLSLYHSAGQMLVGYGVKAEVDGKKIMIGSKLMMEEAGLDLTRGLARIRRLEHLGSSLVYVAADDKLIGLIAIQDTLRAESRRAIDSLRAAGIADIGLITGDTTYIADTVAAELGISHNWGAMLPENKVEVVNKLRSEGRHIIMVGDGVNDTPAMAAADIGIAIGTGCSGPAVETAGILCVGDDPCQVAATVELGKTTMQVLRQNLAFTAGLSVIGIALAAARIISPVTATLLQNFSTLGVIVNSARLLKRDQPKKNNIETNQSYPKPELDLQRFNRQPPAQDSFSASAGRAVSGTIPALSGNCWHSQPLEALIAKLETSGHFGLSEQVAKLRQAQFGYNLLAEGKKPTFWQLFRDQFKDFMVKVLLGAAGLSFFLGKAKDGMLTIAIVLANAFLGAAQEIKAEASIGALQQLAAPMAAVIRGGRTQKIKARELVPGDIIVLEAGDKVPADARILAASHFEVEEASLTGETIPVKKNHLFIATDEMTLGDRRNMVFMGTSVTRGRAQALVDATGMASEMGKIASLINQTEAEITPLQRRLEELGKYLVYGCLGVSGLVMVTGILRGQSLLHMLQTAASLAVAAIPEGLSAIVIIALAMGVQRMAKRNIIVRKMSSIETLGCATVICSDKTGTLTKNEMTVRKVYAGGKLWTVNGEGYSPKGSFAYKGVTVDPAVDANLMQTLLNGALCNNAKLVGQQDTKREKIINLEDKRKRGWYIHGDPTEGALVVAAAKAGFSEEKLAQSYIRLKEIPFESERRMMSVICSGHDGLRTLYAKGAPDSIAAACTHCLYEGQIIPLDEERRREISEAAARMASDALRVLATAYRTLDGEKDLESEPAELEQQLVFCGLVGMIDPPRPEVPEAIAKCKKAGVKVVMITGDHPNTARAIAKELGLLEKDSLVILGCDIDKLSDEQLAAMADTATVYARTAPHHKLRIVKALKDKGYVVAMTGDGVNDAPAVKAADIGIAMGMTGTDVTKEAAGMTLSDDNFATIVKAMEEGRSIYANIRKAIRYLLATNIGEVVLMFAAAVLGMPLPLIPIQLLWINLVGDGLPAIALVNDPPAKNIMDKKPSSANDSVFSGGLGRKILTRGLIIGAVSLACYAWKLAASGSVAAARTLVLAQLAISQFIHIFDCRIERQAGKAGLLSNLPLVGAVGLSMAMVVGAIYLPALQPVFGTIPLSAADWLLAAGAGTITAGLDVIADNVLGRFSNDDKVIEPCQPATMPAV